MKSQTITKTSILIISFLFTITVFAQKNKFLEGKKYTVQFYEMKASGRGKAIADVVAIKGGKIESDLMKEKLKVPPMGLNISVDSTYMEDDAESHLVSFNAWFSDEKDEFKWDVTVTNYDIEGTVIQMKGDVEKKKFEFSGSEKAKK